VSVQPDRDRAFVEVIGVCGDEGVAELRHRVDGLLIAGARFVLGGPVCVPRNARAAGTMRPGNSGPSSPGMITNSGCSA
jgi:hypothetical protein